MCRADQLAACTAVCGRTELMCVAAAVAMCPAYVGCVQVTRRAGCQHVAAHIATTRSSQTCLAGAGWRCSASQVRAAWCVFMCQRRPHGSSARKLGRRQAVDGCRVGVLAGSQACTHAAAATTHHSSARLQRTHFLAASGAAHHAQ